MPSVAGAEDWFVRDEFAEYGAEDGTTYAAAFDGAGDIAWADIACGDTLYVCGINSSRTTANHLAVNKICTAGNPLTISFDCQNDAGSIVGLQNFPAWDTEGTWTNHSGNVWYISTAGWGATVENPVRVWLSGVEYPFSGTAVDNADVSGITSAGRWYYNLAEQRIYLYSTGNPAATYTSISGLQQVNYLIYIASKSYIDIINPRLYGGRLNGAMIYKSDHVNLIGTGSSMITGSQFGIDLHGDTGVESSYCDLHGLNIDSGFEWQTDYVYSSFDGIRIRGGHHNNIYNCALKNWTHNAVNVQTSDTSLLVGCSYNDIYDNEISAPDISYGRAITFDGMDPAGAGGYTQFNKFRLNNVHDMWTRSQINGNNNEATDNIFKTFRNSPWVVNETAQVFHFQVYGDYNVSKDNLIANNTAIDIDGQFLLFTDDTTTRSGHRIINNIGYNVGIDSISLPMAALYIPNQVNISGIETINNLFFSDAAANVVDYRGSSLSVAAFNSADSSGDAISGNIATDPLLDSAGRPRLKSLYDAGTAHDNIYCGSGEPIGAYELCKGMTMPPPLWFLGTPDSYSLGGGRLHIELVTFGGESATFGGETATW